MKEGVRCYLKIFSWRFPLLNSGENKAAKNDGNAIGKKNVNY